jgi:preprotein translocase subunit SecA
MRIFGGERIGTLMSSLQLPDDMPIENKMITRALETAQKRVEGHNFDIRKHLVEYDDVMNSHREVIYKRRRQYLTGQDIKKGMLASFGAIFDRIVRAHTDAHNDSLDLEKIQADAGQFIELPKD